jgi:gliding motility-associated-like protein
MTITVNANATPTFTQVAAICVGGNLTALPLTSNNGITGTWSPVLNTATTTTYTFTPTTGQCATTAIMTITVNAIPTAPTTTPVSYFIGDVATALSATGTNLLWYTTATGGTGSPVAPTPNTSTAGTITYYVTQTNVNNCESLRASLLVTISALPGMPITSPASYCVGDIAIPLTATGTNLLWYTTAIGGLGSPTAPTPITTAALPTSYYVTQTAANGFESARASLLVTVNPIPTAPRITTTTATTFCAGGSVTLTSTAANGNQWYKDNILIIGQTGTTYVATTSGAYTVISTQVGCPSPPSAGITVTVNTVPTPTITATMPTTFCTGGSVILTSNALNGNQWYKDNVLISGETGTTYSATASGTYTVISTISGCPSAASSGIVVNVIASNVASFTVDVVDLTDVNTVTVNATGPGVYQYSLDEPTGPFQDSNLFTNVPAGIHTVYVDDKNGCGTVNKEIALLGLPKFFTPNGDGYNDYWSVKGVNETYNSKSIIYIFNRYGKLLHQWIPASSKGWDGTYNGDTLPVDDYWYRIKLEDGREAKGHFSLKR